MNNDLVAPSYRPSLTTGIVHFGPGAFHRAHQAHYVDLLLQQDPRWGIAAVSLRSPGTVDALRAQDGRLGYEFPDGLVIHAFEQRKLLQHALDQQMGRGFHAPSIAPQQTALLTTINSASNISCEPLVPYPRRSRLGENVRPRKGG